MKGIYFNELTGRFTNIFKENKDLFLLKCEIESLKKEFKLFSYDISTRKCYIPKQHNNWSI